MTSPKKSPGKTDREKRSPWIDATGLLDRLTSRIGIKLTLFLSCVILLSALALIFVSRHLVAQFGELAADLNETGIRRQAYHFLERITRVQSERYGSFFVQAATFTSLVAEQAAAHLASGGSNFKVDEDGADRLHFQADKGMFTNSPQARVSVVYWEEQPIPTDIKRQIAALSPIDSLLEKIQKSSYSAAASWVLMKNSIIRYYPNTPLIDFLPPVSEYDGREDRFFKVAAPENNPERETLWTEVYRDPGGQGLMTTATTPVYNDEGEFLGVAGIDITLDKIVHTILYESTIPEKSSAREWQNEFSFLIDSDGRIIAFPLKHLQRFGLPGIETGARLMAPSLARLSDSTDVAVRRLARKMTSGMKGLEEVTLENERYVISFYPMPSTGWSLGVVAAENDILASITETRDAIHITVQRMTSFLTYITFGLLIASIIISMTYIIKRMVIPLTRLSEAAVKVKEGHFETRVDLVSNDEIGVLAAAFNDMVDRLKDSYEKLADYNRTLEARVAERTAELARKSQEQEETLQLLRENINERREVELRLRESEERYRDIFQNSIEGIFQTTPDDKIIRANPALADILGYPSVADMLANIHNVARQLYVHPEKRREFIRNLETNRTVSGFETQLHRKDGGIIWVIISARAVEGPDGRLQHIQGSIKDISKRKQAEEMIRQARRMAETANRAKSDFLATMSHEIRIPLNAIIGMTELALQTPLTAKQTHYLDTIRDASEHLLSLFDNVLDFSRIEAGKLRLEKAPFDIKRLVDHSLAMLSFQAGEKQVQVTADIDPDVPVCLFGDARRLSQVLLNLLGNALKFTEEGAITVHVSRASAGEETDSAPPDPESGETRQQATLLFSVTDTGIGIAPEKLETVFGSFVQLGGINTRHSGGTGLGLAISRELVGLMGGRIWAESEPKKGSCFQFTVVLCLADTDEAQIVKDRQVDPPRPDNKTPQPGLRVLLAEDFVVNEEIILGILEKYGHKVTAVGNGLDAVKAVRQSHFDVVLMDIRMPVMDGLTAAKRIRGLQNPEAAAVPIVALTAHAVKGDRERFLSAGMNDYLSKPFRSRDLLRTIQNVTAPSAPGTLAVPSSRIANRATDAVVDLEYALHLMDDDPRVLKIACRSMLKNIPLKLAELENAIDAKDFRRAHRLAHSLKSAAKSVGAFPISDIAHTIERACSHYTPYSRKADADITDCMPLLREGMNRMLDQLSDYIP